MPRAGRKRTTVADGRIIFAADDPLVLNGTYDREGYTPKERRALERREQQIGALRSQIRRQHKLPEMRLATARAMTLVRASTWTVPFTSSRSHRLRCDVSNPAMSLSL